LWHNLTGGYFAGSPRAGRATRYYRALARASASFALVAEAALVLLGGALKRRESLSARLGDALSHLYILSAALKRFEDDGRPDADVPLLTWSARHSLYEIDRALDGVLANFPIPPLAWILRLFVFPYGRRGRAANDTLTQSVAEILLKPSAARDRLTSGIYIGVADQPVGQLEEALSAVIAADAISLRLKRTQAQASTQEQTALDRAAELTRAVIAVDDFAPEDVASP